MALSIKPNVSCSPSIANLSTPPNIPEHKEYSPEYTENSFHDFMIDVGYAIELNGGIFNALDGRSSFQASLENSEYECVLTLRGEDWKTSIDEFDLSELWSLLNKGPVDRSRLVGLARDFSMPLFSLLSSIDYLRIVEIAADDRKEPTVAIEKKRRLFSTGLVSA